MTVGWIAKMTDPDVKISGDPEGGFVVEMHDGDRHMAVPLMAESEDAARDEGLRRFQAAAPVAVSPPATVAHVESAVSGAASRFEAMIKEAEARIEARITAMFAPKPVVAPVAVVEPAADVLATPKDHAEPVAHPEA